MILNFHFQAMTIKKKKIVLVVFTTNSMPNLNNIEDGIYNIVGRGSL